MIRKKPKVKQTDPLKKRKKAKIIFFIVFGIIVVLFSSVGFYTYSIFSKYNIDKEFNKDNETLGIASEYATDSSVDITNIAIFGVDQRFNESSRSDAIVVLSIDNVHKKVKLASIMRDSYVQIEGHGKDKITHAYAFGGAQLAVKTLNQNFGLDIKDYATINFSQLAEIVDALGGVTITVDKNEITTLNNEIDSQAQWIKKKPIHITKSGEQVLNGIQALAYARIRHVGNGDYERTDRQRDIMKSLFNKMLKTKIIEYPEISRKILPYIKTSIAMDELLKYAYTISKNSYTIEEVRMPTEGLLKNAGGKMINGVYYLTYDIPTAKDILRKFIYDDIKPE